MNFLWLIIMSQYYVWLKTSLNQNLTNVGVPGLPGEIVQLMDISTGTRKVKETQSIRNLMKKNPIDHYLHMTLYKLPRYLQLILQIMIR